MSTKVPPAARDGVAGHAPVPGAAPRRWRAWALPLVSAGAVAAVVGAVVGIQAATKPHAHETPHPPAISTTAPTPTVVDDWHVESASFISPTEGWALATAACPTGADCPHTPTAVLHTADGVSWSEVGRMTGMRAGTIAFVDSRVGYAWELAAHAFRTDDGGKSWQPIAMGTRPPNYLVVASGRLIGTDEGGNVYRLDGSTMKPTGTQLGGSFHSVLETEGTSAYWVGYAHYTAAEAPDHTTFSVSSDGGVTWKKRTVDCPGHAPSGNFLDARELHFAPDGAVIASCQLRYGVTPLHSVLAVSTDGGQTFGGAEVLDAATVEAAASHSHLFAYATKNFSAARSIDGGRSWLSVPTLDGLYLVYGNPVRFDNEHDGWLIDAGGALWLTHDGGASWARSLGNATARRTNPVAPAPTSSRSRPPTSAVGSVSDVSVAGNDIWVLGGKECGAAYPFSPCAVLKHSADGGITWRLTQVPADWHVVGSKGCGPVCVSHVRFANNRIGYAYDDQTGQGNLYMTTDGGTTWKSLTGGAVALETLDGNVIRIVTTRAGCTPPGCTYAAETADLGSTDWSNPVALASPVGNDVFAGLVRAPGVAYAWEMGNPAGGAENAKSVVSRSTDGGTHWTNIGEPCPQRGGVNGEVDTRDLAVGADGSVVVLCTPRFSPTGGDGRLRVVADGATSAINGPLGSISRLAVGSAGHLCAQTDGLTCSPDGGRTWIKGTTAGDSVGLAWFGFQSATDVRAVTQDGGTTLLWTSHDAGQHWTSGPVG